MARTLDRISGGRLILGQGAGWNYCDCEASGEELGTVASHLRDLDRNMPIIASLLGQLNPGRVARGEWGGD